MNANSQETAEPTEKLFKNIILFIIKNYLLLRILFIINFLLENPIKLLKSL